MPLCVIWGMLQARSNPVRSALSTDMTATFVVYHTVVPDGVVTPVDMDFFRRSLPAKSTRYSLPTRASSAAPVGLVPPTRAARLVTVSITSTWLRLECSFILVAPYALP